MSNKTVLIISPYFPPFNAADMQRVRMSLPYFKVHGWNAEVVTVDEKYVDINKDELLLQSVPSNIKIHTVKALNKKWTSKIGLGSIALRSLWFYYRKVNQLLKTKKYDLVYFSTTQFPVCVLGAYWKKRFHIPYVIDMQDPWHSDYYMNKPKSQRPRKYWFSYSLNKYLEPKAMNNVGGLISVSDDYVTDLQKRYPAVKQIPTATITFGAAAYDLEIVKNHAKNFDSLLDKKNFNIVYVGRGGADMHKAIAPLFEAIKHLNPQILKQLKLYFIGTSYAAQGDGKPTILPFAQEYGIADHVIELTDRISYYHTLLTLQQADAVFIPGSDDPKYTASKIFPYLLTQKPLLAIFNASSSAIDILKEYGVQHVYNYDTVSQANITEFLETLIQRKTQLQQYAPEAIKRYSAENMTLLQCKLFNQVIGI